MSKKIILYGNEHCPDCVRLKEVFDREGIVYGYADVLSGLGFFKRFLAVRDNNPEVFGDIIKAGKIGIPAVIVDGEVYAELQIDGLDLDLFR